MTRGFTRRRIKQTALKLFRDQGYDKTSLREIAEHLDVTKAAVYYHFKTKEGILAELFDEHLEPVEDVIAWAEGQLPGPSTRQEALRRYEAALSRAAPLLAILQENHGVLRDLAVGAAYRDLWTRALALFRDPEADLAGQLRSVTALVGVHAAPRVLEDARGSVEEKRRAALVVGLDLLTSADSGDRPTSSTTSMDTGLSDPPHRSAPVPALKMRDAPPRRA
ncbi:TetR/AcrR family transcriptional regulator [Streptomyces sp. NPDC005248]|uniref:TetR/AcrR family transcriptional regulator n=1 Tax=Streptomyces sp. NPDC005248 TaxID=3364709 RepID=UPI0036749EC9